MVTRKRSPWSALKKRIVALSATAIVGLFGWGTQTTIRWLAGIESRLTTLENYSHKDHEPLDRRVRRLERYHPQRRNRSETPPPQEGIGDEKTPH